MNYTLLVVITLIVGYVGGYMVAKNKPMSKEDRKELQRLKDLEQRVRDLAITYNHEPWVVILEDELRENRRQELN